METTISDGASLVTDRNRGSIIHGIVRLEHHTACSQKIECYLSGHLEERNQQEAIHHYITSHENMWHKHHTLFCFQLNLTHPAVTTMLYLRDVTNVLLPKPDNHITKVQKKRAIFRFPQNASAWHLCFLSPGSHKYRRSYSKVVYETAILGPQLSHEA